ncbi:MULTISPECIES: hypothetical protein [Snodgrassella]|uniref:hypothetical protein n=1 Tax=Snodgrassella TaxID=1193515 RepID=UPI00226A50CE|nr:MULTISPECIES: hypothetical protein [unclassified Snodgrassella]MCX8749624.1 hypothetical protein [Snodgrassella sp. B3088]MCX8752528.1 hypothetical protein [Snodgrassella sp. B3837]
MEIILSTEVKEKIALRQWSNDTLIGGTCNDYMEGDYGNDTYVFAKVHGQDIINDIQGTADTIQFADVDFEEESLTKIAYFN